MVARLGLDTLRTTLDGVIGDLFGVFALRAGNAHQVPFGGTQRAKKIAATVSLPPDMHNTGPGQAAAQRATAMRTASRQQPSSSDRLQTGAAPLQGNENERRVR